MKKLTVKDILKICDGKLILGENEVVCESYSKDTRNINTGDIYLGIKGERINGSSLYEEALIKGAKGCILQDVEVKEEIKQKYSDRFIIMVPNVVEALQKMAIAVRNTCNDMPVIGITGSVGKTSTKDIIANVLAQKYDVLKTQGNYNNEIGLPLTILGLNNQNAMVLEMGMSAIGEIDLLTKIAKPTSAVITIIGSSHIGELGSRENILNAKLEILNGLEKNGKLLINNDNDLLSKWNNENNLPNIITYGIENKSDLQAYDIKLYENRSEFKLKVDEKEYSIKVPVGGRHFIYNSLASIGIGLTYNIEMDKIIHRNRNI